MPTEIEMRARFDQATAKMFRDLLAVNAEDLGTDNRQIYFYVLPDKLIKVTDQISKEVGRISLKENRIGEGSVFPETEIIIAPEDVPNAVRLLDSLGLDRHEAFNRRHNFRYGDVEIALKWSEAWGDHAEFEILLPSDTPTAEEVEVAEDAIRQAAQDFGIRLMTDDELREFTRQFEQSPESS